MASERVTLFEEVCSTDFLKFKFGGRGYQDQLYDSIAKTEALAGVSVELISVIIPGSIEPVKIVWVAHNFGFLGGSLGCAEGEKITRAFEYGLQNKIPVCVQCRTGGARMQEGTSSLMQMAKVSVAVEALHLAGIAFVSVLNDPTYGGVSASYAMQADVRIALPGARIGFAGPAVILNTMCGADESVFDNSCPPDFQSAAYNFKYGQIDMVMPVGGVDETAAGMQVRVEAQVAQVCFQLAHTPITHTTTGAGGDAGGVMRDVEVTVEDQASVFNYTRSRIIDRPQTQDIIHTVLDNFIELSGDGRVGRDVCIRGGLATFTPTDGSSVVRVVVIATFKGHTPQEMLEANYGMASPHGYRTAMKLMLLAERFHIPVITLVDTVGAWPTFACEEAGQSEAIASNLTLMAGLSVPIITLLVGEGGSGGALGVGMGNKIGMLSGGYFGVISPEGAASILGRYASDADKTHQFPLDCQALATAQCIYANQLTELGVVDEIIWESSATETYTHFPILHSRISSFLTSSLAQLSVMSEKEVVTHRYNKYRQLGTFASLDAAGRAAAIVEAKQRYSPAPRPPRTNTTPSPLILHLSDEIITGTYSRYKHLAPSSLPTSAPSLPPHFPILTATTATTTATTSGAGDADAATHVPLKRVTAKHILDTQGPVAVAEWVKEQKRVLITDTTMRDAHQSLLATRVRTEDVVKGAAIAHSLLADAFSLECWGGATFDVCMRFLDECPWERLREIRAACPDICLQMLIRGANAVGYTSYPDNVVTEFVKLAAENGMDVFRIFDCFNIIENMQVAIDAVVAANKIAEVCICYTGDVLTSDIYNLEYYKQVASQAAAAGAHMIGLKDMAGLLRPLEARPILAAIRSVTHLPVHFHTHATSSASLATCYEMASAGCDVIDVCTASMADGTSQPSMNALLAILQGSERDTGISYLALEPYDIYWARVRDMYSPFESGMKSGTARVFEHQIPGGQYSNLIVQCQSMGLWERWEEVLDAYRDVNQLFGDIVKVTPSSKCVGDLALYLVTRHLHASDLTDPVIAASVDYPESVVGLMRGELGLPHRGFPLAVETAILKGIPKLTVRAGIALPPVDFVANQQSVSELMGCEVTAEQAMSYLMYPKVFSDYFKRQLTKGGRLLRLLPSLVYFYGLLPGEGFTLHARGVDAAGVTNAIADSTESSEHLIRIELQRVGPLKDGKRACVWSVDGRQQIAEVADNSGQFVFQGPMAAEGQGGQLGSPMPGVVEKVLVSVGQHVQAGDVLCTVSAMKMEVKVTAPGAGDITLISAPTGTRVVEGALLVTLTLTL